MLCVFAPLRETVFFFYTFEPDPLIKYRLSMTDSQIDVSQFAEGAADSSEEDVFVFPLSFSQQRLWFLHQLDPLGATYNVPAATRLAGHLNLHALEATLSEIVRRHEVLRTNFDIVDDEPVQVISAHAPVPLRVTDLSAQPDADREEEVRRLAAEEARKPFNLSTGPLLRTRLLRLDEDDHVLLLVMHHIISDGWSITVLINEIAALYKAFAAGEPSPLEELTVQYADYAQWQRDWLQGERMDEQLAYWKGQLAGAPTVLELPTDNARPPVQTFRGALVMFRLSAHLSKELNALCLREGVTLFMLLLAAFQTLLYRYTGQPDIVVGTPIAGRSRSELENLIGFFINTLILRADLSGNPCFLDLLRQVKEVALGAYAHQDLPFEKLVEELQPERDLSHMPLVQVLFALQNTPDAALDLPGLTLSGIEADSGTSRFDLTLDVSETERGIEGSMRYKSDLFNEDSIERLLGHFQNLLAAIVINPNQRIGDLKLLTQAEQKQLQLWNTTQVDYEAEPLLHTLFEEQAKRTPDAIAVVFEDERVSYRELDERANRLAHHLQSMGVGPDVLVAVCLERSVEMVLALLGVLKAGGAYVPLDPSYPRERLAFMLDDSRAPVLISQQGLLDTLPDTIAQTLCLDTQWKTIAASQSVENMRAAVARENLAYMIYTSGSTGRPKGAMNTHGAICNRLLWMQRAYVLDESDAVLQKTPFSFDVSVWEFFWPLLAGARLVMARPGGHQDAAYLVETIARERITTLHFVPSMLQVFLEERELSRCHSLRRIICSGEALPFEFQEKFFGRLDAELHNLYGPTEAAVDVTSWRCERVGARAHVPIGRPIANTQIYLLDPSLNLLPVGVPGELHIGGAALARGYFNRPDLTAEKFIPNPFSTLPGARLYRTGDLARRLATGEIEFLGRLDHQVKVRGFRIELGEIEAVLLQHASVREAVVLAREDTPGDKRLVCYLAASHGTDVSVSVGEMREYLQSRLPDYMIPSHFIMLAELPLTPNGKVDRKALPAPDASRPELKQSYVEPSRPLELLLAEMWREILGLEKVGVQDNFFELGGDSIKGAIFINHLQERLGEIVHVVVLFTSPTIAQLVAYLEEHYKEAVAKLPGHKSEKFSGADTRDDKPQTLAHVDAEKIEQARQLIRTLPPREKFTNSSASRNPPAIFILSPPRSGSTLMRVMLAGHPALFAPPELELLSFNTLGERAATFTGAQAFWLEGALRAIMEARGCDAEQAKALMREYEASGWTTREFYRELQSWLGRRRLVDKTPSYALDDSILRRAEEDFENALYIHLIRHPYGMIHSFEEAKMDQVFFGTGHPFSTRELAEIIWTISHQNILNFLHVIPAKRQHQLRFEELLSEPVEVLQSLCDFLGLELHPNMLQPYREKEKRMTDGLYKESRMLGDVKFHQHDSINAGVADRWTQKYREDFLGDNARQLASQLGYTFAESASAQASAAERAEQPLTASTRNELSAIRRFAREDGQPIPLSFAQQRLFFLDKVVPRKSAYNIPIAVRIKGALDVEALLRGLNQIVGRHESLRTSFPVVDGVPAQRIAPKSFVTLLLMDLRELPIEARESTLRKITTDEARLHFELKRGPLLRATLLELDDEEHVLIANMHHIISDGWSIGIFVHELAMIYDALVAGRESQLAPLPVQYADFAIWQRGFLEGEMLEAQLDYWKQKLSGASLLQLPTDRPHPPSQTFRGADYASVLSQDLSQSLLDLSRREGVTPFMTLLAAFKILLSRYAGQTDIIIGTPIAGRTRREVEGLIGFFVNTLVMRTDLSGNPGFRELLRRVKETALGAYAHQDLPFEKLVEELQLARDNSRTPLFQVMFALQNAPRPETKTSTGLTLSAVEIDGGAAKFDLTLAVQETDGGLGVGVEYNTDLFDAATIERMLRHFEILLEDIVANPDKRINELAMLTEDEQRQTQSSEHSQLAADVFSHSGLHQIFEAQAERTPDAVALIFGAGRLTYRELNERANSLAHHLQSIGVGADALVAILLQRSVEMIVALLAVLKAGGAYLPLDPLYPQERLAFMLDDASASVLLTQSSLLERVPPHDAQVLLLDTGAEMFAAGSANNPRSGIEAENLAYVIYTSGSTGRPKGVGITHSNAAALLGWSREQFTAADLSGVMASTSICFDLSIFEIFAPLSCGGKVVLAENALALRGLAAAGDVTLVNTVPSAMAELMRINALPPSVRVVNLAGEALKGALVKQIYQAGQVERVINLYGPTEDTTYSTVSEIGRDEDREPTIGRAIRGTQAYVLDKSLQVVAVGVIGELYLGGAGLARGYVGRPDLTAERFIPNAYSTTPGARVYGTGDLARRLASGEIEFLGRADHQVKIRGYRIELGEIEAALTQHACVSEAVVVAREDAPGDKRLVAYLVSTEGNAPTVEDLRNYLKTKLPEYLIPSVFLLLDELPLTPNGKVDRQALPAPGALRVEASKAGFIAPRNDAEVQLAQLWEEVLNVKPVGVRDNFFELGGHSLLAVKLFARIEQVTGSALPMSSLFDGATVEQQSKLLGKPRTASQASSLVPIQPQGNLPPLFCAHPWGGDVICYSELAKRLGEEQPVYGLQARGVENKENPHHSIEEMASAYLLEMRGLQKEGPYFLCGWSSGGLIAFEMARQLELQGQPVGLLALIDTYNITEIYTQAELEGKNSAQRAASFVCEAQIVSYTGETVFAQVKYDEQIGLAYKLPVGFGLVQGRHFLNEYVNYYLYIERAIQSYAPHPFGGRAIHFWTKSRLSKVTPETKRRWSELSTGGIQIEEVPGAHFTILREPNVQSLAARLKKYLEPEAATPKG